MSSLVFEFVDGSQEIVWPNSPRHRELMADGHAPVGSVPESDGVSDALEAYLEGKFTEVATEVAPGIVAPQVTAAQTARTAAETARTGAETAAASIQREQANGVAGLTAAGKLYEARVPDRLSDASLATTIATQGGGLFAPQAAASSAAQRVLSRIKRNTDDVTILNMSDSTGVYSSTEPRWFRKLAEKMMLDWPTHTFTFVPWDDTAQNWASPTILQTGTGPYSVKFYNAAVTGTKMDYFLGSRFPFITALQPDLLFTNYGLNDGSTDLAGAKAHGRERILMLTESVTADCPGASVIILSQTERTDVSNEVQAARASRYARAAEQRGYGFIDTRQAFVDDPRGLAALLNGDGLHPNNAGSDLQRDTIYPHMVYRPSLQPRTMLPSCFLTVGGNLLTNGDFSSFASPPTLTGWTANNATLSKDTTHFEGPNGYSVNIAAASAAASSMDQNFNLATVKGKWITAAARVYVPAGQANTAGRIALQCGDGADVTSIGNNSARDGWQWIVVSKRISTTATFARLRVYGDSAASSSANVSVDRVVAVFGQLPRDVR